MRVLLVHNYYGSSAPSGENQVFEVERVMLQQHRVTVDVFTRHSDEIRGTKVKVEGEGERWTCRFLSKVRKLHGLIKEALCTVANPFAARALRQKIREFKPDVVHFHNTFPLISPLTIRAAKKSGAKVVMTLHNYRMVCAAGIPMRCGKVCRDCFFDAANRSILPALRHRCYRGSLLATLPLALNIWLYRKCWAKWVDKFIVLSEFQKQIMIECGLPTEKIVVKGNFVQSIILNNPTNRTTRSGVVFVGRLSDEKGLKTLLRAWRILEEWHKKGGAPGGRARPARTMGCDAPLLTLIGDGVQRAEYESLAKGLNVRFLGKLPHEQVLEELARAKMLVMPSECWETFGLVVVEAAMCGTPAVVSDLGALPGIVKRLRVGKVVKAGDAEALAKSVFGYLSSECLSEGEWKFNVAEFCEEGNYSELISIYQSLVQRCYDKCH